MKNSNNPPDPNEFLLLDFDTGSAATGWAMFAVHVGAFAKPQAYIQEHLLWWDCGEVSGTETAILGKCVQLIDWCAARVKLANRIIPPVPLLHIGTEDFDLTQTKGSSENLLSPVRQNAVLNWECWKRGIELKYFRRNLRTSVTRERLELYGFEGKFRKDEFAAMQHGIVHLRQLKRDSISSPWRVQQLGDRSVGRYGS